MNTEQNLVNLEYLEKFTKGDNDKVRKYIEMYLKNTPKVIRDFQKELELKNFENIRLKAHSIKPQAKYFGIEILEKILLEIELIILNGNDMSKLQPLIDNASKINGEIVNELTKKLNT